MAAIKEIFLMCDLCFVSFGVDDRHRNVAEQRKAAAKNGWLYSGNVDYCPHCRPKKKDGTNIKSNHQPHKP